MEDMKPKIRRTHDLALILHDETPTDEHPLEITRPSSERPKVPSLNDKPLQSLPSPSVHILGVDQSNSYQPRYSCNLQAPILPVYSLPTTACTRDVKHPLTSPSITMKPTLQDNWNNRTLGRRTRSQLNLLPAGSPIFETSQPPCKIRATETPNLPVLRPISQKNGTVHAIEKPCDNSGERACLPLPESNSQSGQAIILSPPQPAEPNSGELNIICQSPNGPGLRPRTLHSDLPTMKSHVNFPRPCGAVSRCAPDLNRLPSFKYLTQSLENDDASRDTSAGQSVFGNPSKLKHGCPPRPWDPKLEDDDHLSKNGGHSSPSVQHDTVNSNVMYVNNVVQNVYVPSQKHHQEADARPQCPPQLSLRHNPMSETVKSRAQHHITQNYLNEDGRIYDLAKIRQVGLTVISGRVYNQQNHPMCAAPRENGNPCKRNVSRSACRWHGPVRVLTPHNTMNGLLDGSGNLTHIDTSFNGNARNSGGRSSESGQQRNISADLPVLHSSPPRVVARSLRWNNEEHYWFLLGLQRYGHRWSTISKVVRTRDTLQVQSHAQKYFERQNKVDKKKSTIHDLRIDGIELSEVAAKYTAEEVHWRVNLVDADIRTGSRSTAAPSGN